MCSLTSVAGSDYTAQSVELTFPRGSERQCHSVPILDDDLCEFPSEDFFADLAYVSGRQIININFPNTRVVIDDTNEPECGKFRIFFVS